MSILYKHTKDLVFEVSIEKRTNQENIKMLFSNDGGKFGGHEILDGYNLTPKRLLEILQDRNDYSEEELNF